MLLTILSSLAQDESRNISENSTWGIRKRFEVGQHKMSTARFLGYDTNEAGKLVVTKKRVMNDGEIQQFYIENDHEAIIEPWIWACVQLEMERRKRYLEEHGTNSFSHNTEQNPFAAKIICGKCGKVFHRISWLAFLI